MKKLILLTLIVILTACSSLGTSEFARNKTKWEGAKITHYRYNLSIGCFCAFRDDMPLTIEVKDGKTVSITNAKGAVVDSSNPSAELYVPYSTVDGVFVKLEDDLAADPDQITVDYDPTNGYPAQVYIDYISAAADDEISYEITNFEILK